MAEKDYYKILGIEKEASKEDIKKAYKKLAKKYHPDLNKGDATAEKRFKEVNEAASILGDDQKRQQYDQFGSEGMKYGGGAGGFGGFGGAQQGFDMNDIFNQFFGGGGFGGFGGGGQRRGPQQGSDLRFDMEITLEDVATGLDKEIKIKVADSCHVCKGKGGKGIETCKTCNGRGVVMQQKRTAFGVFQTQTTCPTCQGTGETIKEPCDHCNGTGREIREKKIKVSIPAGVDEGTRLRIAGEGEAGERNAPHGDLYIYLHIKSNEMFTRDGADLYIDVPLRYSQAVNGDTIEIPHILGKAKLKIPAGTQPGTLLRMKEKGLPKLRGSGKGDQYVRVTIDVPTKVSKKQKELLDEFDKQTKEKRPHEKLFEKIKEAFK